MFPRAPPASAVSSCSESGVFGPVVGVIGSMQAMETLKVLVGWEGEWFNQMAISFFSAVSLAGRLFVYDALAVTSRVITLRSRDPDCEVCGARAETMGEWPHTDYEQFCGVKACDKVGGFVTT